MKKLQVSLTLKKKKLWLIRVTRAWHAIKYLDPRESGAVLPILHLNGFKISERTIFGCMDDAELVALFTGYGYKVCIVGKTGDTEEPAILDRQLSSALEWALHEIHLIQAAARQGEAIIKPRWPMIILRTPKVRAAFESSCNFLLTVLC
jgi:xylulose-5-phosphate/fructose-6-phosphate phosphoketolase